MAFESRQAELAELAEVIEAKGVTNRAKAKAARLTEAVAKRPAEDDAPADTEAKKSMCVDAEDAVRMLLQGMVRVLQIRLKEGKGPLPLANLEDQFKACGSCLASCSGLLRTTQYPS